jgi:hypothetical protein
VTLRHLRHFRDGYPLCWPQDKDGDFDATLVEGKVTCPDCLALMKETA